ncbi:aspartate racemase/maleate isomerase family protein [Streptomyces sp. NPDC001100]
MRRLILAQASFKASAAVPTFSASGGIRSSTASTTKNVPVTAPDAPYLKPLTQLVADYIEDAGIEVVDALSLEVPDNLAVARLDPADLREHWRRLDLSRADALVLSACVQMPSLASIQPVEEAAGLPVLSAATATAYRALVEPGLPAVVPGAGSLLSGRAGAGGQNGPGPGRP